MLCTFFDQVRIYRLLLVLEMDWTASQDFLHTNYGVWTLDQLNKDQAHAAERFLTERALSKGKLNAQGFPVLKYDDLGERVGMPSPAALRKLELLWREATGYSGDELEETYRDFLKHTYGIQDPRWISKQKYTQVKNKLDELVTVRFRGMAAAQQKIRSGT